MIDYAWYGCDGDGNIRLAARADSAGVVSLALSDGRLFTQTAATDVNDGVVLFTFHTSADIGGTLVHGGITYDYPLSIRPLKPERIRVLAYSCASAVFDAEMSYGAMYSVRPDLIIMLGDFVYADASNGLFNTEDRVTVRDVVIATAGPDAYRPHYRGVKKGKNWKRLAACTPQIGTWDDHEIFDAWSMGSINNINKYVGEGTAVEQIQESDSDAVKATKMQAIFDAADQVMYENFWITNPPNTDAGIDADARYFRVRVGNTLEIIVPDHMTYRDMTDNLNGGDYTDLSGYPYYDDTEHDQRQMLYPTQLAWTLNVLANAESDGVAHKLLAMAKQPYEHNSDAANNGDTFTIYTSERDALVEAFDDLTGAVWIAADSHQACVFRNADHNFLAIEPCSLSSGYHQQGVGYSADAVWKIWGNSGQPATDQTVWVFGLVDVTPDKQVHRIVHAKNARTLWGPYRINAGEVATKPRRTRIG
jgi:hypothetical protein